MARISETNQVQRCAREPHPTARRTSIIIRKDGTRREVPFELVPRPFRFGSPAANG